MNKKTITITAITTITIAAIILGIKKFQKFVNQPLPENPNKPKSNK